MSNIKFFLIIVSRPERTSSDVSRLRIHSRSDPNHKLLLLSRSGRSRPQLQAQSSILLLLIIDSTEQPLSQGGLLRRFGRVHIAPSFLDRRHCGHAFTQP